LWRVVGTLDLSGFTREARTAQLPAMLLADANHAKHRASPSLVLIAEIVAWRERMKTEAAKRAYRSRAGLCELVNAHFKSHHGTAQVLVRGLGKVTCVALLAALANNLLAHITSLLA
jgi:hypothetical protein